MANEVTFLFLPPEYAHLSPTGLLRSDHLPPLPQDVVVGVMEILDKPEPNPKPAE